MSHHCHSNTDEKQCTCATQEAVPVQVSDKPWLATLEVHEETKRDSLVIMGTLGHYLVVHQFEFDQPEDGITDVAFKVVVPVIVPREFGDRLEPVQSDQCSISVAHEESPELNEVGLEILRTRVTESQCMVLLSTNQTWDKRDAPMRTSEPNTWTEVSRGCTGQLMTALKTPASWGGTMLLNAASATLTLNGEKADTKRHSVEVSGEDLALLSE